MTIHEVAHLIAALSIGLMPEKLKFQPYGVNLTLKNKIIYSFSDEVILYLSGPFTNIFLSLICLLIFGRGKTSDYFTYATYCFF